MFVIAAATLAVVAAALPAAGVSKSDPSRSIKQQCGHGIPAYNTGPEVVFGRVATAPAAETLRAKVAGAGFKNASVEQECNGYRIVVRGYDTFDTAVALQAEAKKTAFHPTVECYQAPDKGGEPEACGGYEVIVNGFTDRASADAFVATAYSIGFDARLETNS